MIDYHPSSCSYPPSASWWRHSHILYNNASCTLSTLHLFISERLQHINIIKLQMNKWHDSTKQKNESKQMTFVFASTRSDWIIIWSLIYCALVLHLLHNFLEKLAPVISLTNCGGASAVLGGDGGRGPRSKVCPVSPWPSPNAVSNCAMFVLVTSFYLAFSGADIESDFVLMITVYSQ